MPRKPKMPAAPALPPTPPSSLRDIALNQKITADLQALVFKLDQRALDRAVVLAHQAARRRGPLVQHFIEIGTRFGEELETSHKPALRVVEGGAASKELEAPRAEEQL